MHERSAASTVPVTVGEVVPDDLQSAAALCQQTLAPLLDADWEQPVASLKWSRRRTSSTSRTRSTGTPAADRPSPERFDSLGLRLRRPADPAILAIVQSGRSLLAQLSTVAAPSARGTTTGADPIVTAYLAMGCAEILLHTDDIAQSFGHMLTGRTRSADTLSSVCSRGHRRPGGRWLVAVALGDRPADLPEHRPVAPDWTWHASPVEEWDGEIKTRASYPPIHS